MTERREHPRIDNCLPVKISDNEFDLVTETKNISVSGVYCSVSKLVNLMTKLNMVLLVPRKKNRIESIKKITCQGIVVRIEDARNVKDNGKHPYSIGIYFSDIKAQDKKILASYINSHIEQKKDLPLGV